MDRTTVYRDQLPYETDILGLQRQAYQGFGLLALDLFGSATSVARFPCGPTAPTSMAVMVGPGTIYVLKNLDDAPWGDRDAVGGAPDETTQFYNVANPGVGFTDDVSRTRRNLANLYLITGTSGASPSIPPTTAGRVPIWVITVAHTDTTVTAGNIAAHPSAPFVDVGGGGGGGTPLTPWAVVASNHTAVAGERLILDATGGTFTLTLPATPVAGNEGIRIKGNFLTTNVTVARNGHTIAGSATNLTLDKDYVDIELVYDGTTWRV
jgi:hypothetical protein